MRNKERSLLQIIKERSPVTVVGIILLSITATVVYDLAVKPGLSSAGRFFLNIMTLGSQKVQDTAYAEAAIDPTPVTSLILLLFLVGVILPPSYNKFIFPVLRAD
jgi:hypothetical protein